MKKTMPKTICLDCGIPTPNPSRCDNCKAEWLAKHPRRPARIGRASREARGYDDAWRKVRLQILNRDAWVCYLCNKKLVGSDATVDHVVPISVNPALRLEPTNLKACCRGCNSGRKGQK